MRGHTILVLALVGSAPLVGTPAHAQKRSSKIRAPAKGKIFGGGLRPVRPRRKFGKQTYKFPLAPVMGYGAGPTGSVGGVHAGEITIATRPWAETLSARDRRVLQIGNPLSPFTWVARVPVVTETGYEWRNKLFWHATDLDKVKANGEVDQSGKSSAGLYRAGGPEE